MFVRVSSIKNGSDSPIVIPTEVGHVSDHSCERGNDSSSSQTKRTDAQSDREHEHICRGPNRMTAVGRQGLTVGERSEDKCSARVPHLLATPDDSACVLMYHATSPATTAAADHASCATQRM